MLSAQILILSARMDGCRLFRYVVLLTMVVGIQDQQCQVGFYGSSCQHPCPMTCNNQQCNIDEVGRTVCTHGCVDGYRGTSCGIPCPVNCQVCERVNGSCINCKATFHGTNCTLTCGELCKGFLCDTAQTCSKTTCLDGRYGQNCSNKCYPRYLTCARSTGGCTACRDGYYGQFCELDCPRCGFSDGSVDQTCKNGCNTISCSDITGGDYGRNIRLTVFVPVVLLLVIAIAVILCLWWRSHNKIIRKKRETDEEVQERMLEEKHTKSRKKRETDEEVQERMLEEKHTKRLDLYKWINHPLFESSDEEIGGPAFFTSGSEHIGSTFSSLVTTNYGDDGSNYITIHSNISVCVDSKDEPALQRVTK